MDPLQGLKPSVVCLSPLKWVEPFCISKPPHAREEEEEGVYECNPQSIIHKLRQINLVRCFSNKNLSAVARANRCNF